MPILSKAETNRVYEEYEDESPTFSERLNRVLNDYDAMRAALEAWVAWYTAPLDGPVIKADEAVELTKAAGIHIEDSA